MGSEVPGAPVMNGVLPEHRYAECANGYRMHYIDRGEGPVVVWLHGSGPGASGHSNFKGNYPAISDAGYRSIVLDIVGFGFSDKPENEQYTLDFFVECAAQALDAIGIDRCVVVGNSLGGAIAIGLALARPQLVEKLILMAPGGLSSMEEYGQMPGMQKMFAVYGSGEPVTHDVMKELFAFGLMHDARHATDELVAERMQVMALMNSQVMASMQIPELGSRRAHDARKRHHELREELLKSAPHTGVRMRSLGDGGARGHVQPHVPGLPAERLTPDSRATPPCKLLSFAVPLTEIPGRQT